MEIYLSKITVTHMDASNDEGRILYDKNFFLLEKLKLPKQQKNEHIIRISSIKF